jgi:hypothetical protein
MQNMTIDLETLETVTGGANGCVKLSRRLARTAAESYPVSSGINDAQRVSALFAYQAANERVCDALATRGIVQPTPGQPSPF